jgi:hypothetical protein
MIPTEYSNASGLFYSLKLWVKELDSISFAGSYEMDADILVTKAEWTKMIADEIWKITGYRFM